MCGDADEHSDKVRGLVQMQFHILLTLTYNLVW